MATTPPIIAIDIDDVLSDHAQSLVDFSNERWGTHLTIDDYSEHWAKMWQVDNAEAEIRAEQFRTSVAVAKYHHVNTALPVLQFLSSKYRLVIITSRRLETEKETRAWIAEYYPSIFSEIHFARIWDTIDADAHLRTKGGICKAIGATYLIDDQLKHCITAAECGAKSLLFGDYAWNRSTELLDNVTRTKDWGEVQEYFDKR